MCFALNLSLAMKSTLTAILLGQCLLGLLPPQSASGLFRVPWKGSIRVLLGFRVSGLRAWGSMVVA